MFRSQFRIGNQLDPMLWQFPPTLGFDADRLLALVAGYMAAKPLGQGNGVERCVNLHVVVEVDEHVALANGCLRCECGPPWGYPPPARFGRGPPTGQARLFDLPPRTTGPQQNWLPTKTIDWLGGCTVRGLRQD